ncbi:hypothetical protein E4N62_23480 [Streptomyces sp. MNU76]|uniref:hypothetical protein n=1 Tax=Streptomyces sp. MNU76 TaxID=2560026 RepID=UPI001E5510DF|nr:hypothetical protein [Streptomyces sp. MNU76]MCC9707957.1 hypothetical protein [Streptomyces sp. MNU76]
MASLLPTPSTSENTGPGHAAQGGMNLRHVVSLLPTPLVGDSKGARQATAPNPRSSSPTLTDLTFSGALLPTPRASENENRQTKRTPSQEAGTHGKCLAAEVASLPDPAPTSASTARPSRAGKGSSGAPLPGQLTLWDG